MPGPGTSTAKGYFGKKRAAASSKEKKTPRKK